MPTEPTPYQGETYYGMPALKSSHYRWSIITYFFIGGLASAAQFIATVVDLFGRPRDRSLVRAGRYIALGGASLSPLLLISDLHTPQRWYNMLRIYRRTSAMSIGSWALSIFGIFSGLVAVGQMLEDLFGWAIARGVARAASLPAALSGGVVSLYTGTLLAATNLPLWSSAVPFVSSLFASSAASTATATLTLAAEAAGAPEDTRRRLSWLGVIAGAAELVFATLIGASWRRQRVEGPLQQPRLGAAWRWGVLGLGISGPLAVHVTEAVRGRESRQASTLAALAMLAGGFLLRAVFILGGNESVLQPEDYFRLTQPGANK